MKLLKKAVRGDEQHHTLVEHKEIPRHSVKMGVGTYWHQGSLTTIVEGEHKEDGHRTYHYCLTLTTDDLATLVENAIALAHRGSVTNTAEPAATFSKAVGALIRQSLAAH